MSAALRQKVADARAQIAGQTAPYRARYEALQPREQTLVSIAAAVVIAALLYSAIWQPIVHHRQQLASELQSARTIASNLAQAEVDQRFAAPQSGPIVGSDVSLLTAVDQASKNGTLKKPPARLQPDGENQARIWFEDVEFDVLLRWMNELQTRYGVRIEVADIERQPTPGLVNARLAVIRAP